MNSKGFMRLHRQLIDWEWFDNSQMVHVWIYFLLKANYQDSKWHGIDIPRGSFITSLDTICKDTGLSLQNVRTCMNKLKSTGEITTKSTNRYSVITICKYETYNLQESDTNKQDNKQTNIQSTSNQHAINTQLTTDKESKEIEELKKENKRLKEELANASKKKEASSELENEFDNFRKKYKQYGGQARGLQTELDNLKKKHKDWKEIIPLLSSAIEKENSARKNAEIKGVFFPSMKNLQTYINQRSWEAYADEQQVEDDNEYHPTTDGIFQFWNEERCCLMFNGYIDQLNDGYTKDNRPDGAKVAWNMYEWIWSSQTKQWVKQ